MATPFDRRGVATPARVDRIAAAAVVLLLLASLSRSVLRPPPPAPSSAPSPAPPAAAAGTGATGESTAGRPAPTTRGGPRVRFEFQAEVGAKEVGPPVRLRLRSPDGAQRSFDFTTRDEPARTRFAMEVELPLEQPELPLRGELVGESWCIPPGLLDFEIARLDRPCALVIARAKRLEVSALDVEGGALAGVRIVHESGRLLATTAADGRAKLVRPLRAGRDALVALAAGFAPALVDGGGAPVVLRSAKSMGLLHGVVRSADGAAVAGASIEPRWFAGGAPPGDAMTPTAAAARALYALAERTRERPLAALATTSGADGSFELALPFPGRLILTASHRDLGRCSLTLDLAEGAAAAGRRTDAELRFPRLLALTVTATLDGAPAPRCVVEAVGGGAAGPTVLAAATCDPKGRAKLDVPDLPPLFLVFRSDAAAPRVVELEAKGEAKGEASAARDEALERGRALRCKLVRPGADPAGTIVEARDVASRILLATATADAHGAVRFARLPSSRSFDLLLPIAGGESSPLATGLVLEKRAETGEVDLGELAVAGK
jgi:hypothetical protein